MWTVDDMELGLVKMPGLGYIKHTGKRFVRFEQVKRQVHICMKTEL